MKNTILRAQVWSKITRDNINIIWSILSTRPPRSTDRNKILCNSQHGFRCKRSCESQLVVTVDEIANQLAAGHHVDVILLDFRKAFDKEPHGRLPRSFVRSTVKSPCCPKCGGSGYILPAINYFHVRSCSCA